VVSKLPMIYMAWQSSRRPYRPSRFAAQFVLSGCFVEASAMSSGGHGSTKEAQDSFLFTADVAVFADEGSIL